MPTSRPVTTCSGCSIVPCSSLIRAWSPSISRAFSFDGGGEVMKSVDVSLERTRPAACQEDPSVLVLDPARLGPAHVGAIDVDQIQDNACDHGLASANGKLSQLLDVEAILDDLGQKAGRRQLCAREERSERSENTLTAPKAFAAAYESTVYPPNSHLPLARSPNRQCRAPDGRSCSV